MKDDTRALGASFANFAQIDSHQVALIADELKIEIPPAPGDDFFDGMTNRQMEITGLIITGNPRKTTAQIMGVTENTVGGYIKAVLGKLDAHRCEEVPAQYFGPPDQVQFAEFVKDYNLTEYEAKTLRLCLQGRSREAIAAEMNISALTIGSHLKEIFRKTNIHRHDDLFVAVHSHGAFATDYHGRPVPSFASPAVA